MGKKPDKETLSKIEEWQEKKAKAKEKTLEFGIADNVIANLKNIIDQNLSEEQINWRIEKVEDYLKQCLKSHEIKNKQIAEAIAYNTQAKTRGFDQRMIVPSAKDDWEVEKVPQAVIKELKSVVS